ncbi:hypothetical protein Hanom_Chr13g01199741 [Helianthus anomalus]
MILEKCFISSVNTFSSKKTYIRTLKRKTNYYLFMSKLQVLFFMFVPNFRRCHLPLKLMTFVLYVTKSCTLCPLGQIQL